MLFVFPIRMPDGSCAGVLWPWTSIVTFPSVTIIHFKSHCSNQPYLKAKDCFGRTALTWTPLWRSNVEILSKEHPFSFGARDLRGKRKDIYLIYFWIWQTPNFAPLFYPKYCQLVKLTNDIKILCAPLKLTETSVNKVRNQKPIFTRTSAALAAAWCLGRTKNQWQKHKAWQNWLLSVCVPVLFTLLELWFLGIAKKKKKTSSFFIMLVC